MPWTIAFQQHDELGRPAGRQPITFEGLPDSVGDKILAFILPVVRSAEAAARVKNAVDPFRDALDALAGAVIDTHRKDRRK